MAAVTARLTVDRAGVGPAPGRDRPRTAGQEATGATRVLRQLDGPAGSLLHRASALAGAQAAAGTDRMLPVPAPLHPVLPGLRRGSTVVVRTGARSLVLALLAGVSTGGGWSAVVGMPELGGLAAAQAGVDLDRLVLVPHPGPEWPVAVAALLDGVDLVVVAPTGAVPPRVTSRLAARARLRGSVLLPYGRWEGADLTLATEDHVWQGLGAGRGRLRWREVTVVARGRGAAHQPRRVRVQLPGPTGRLAAPPVEAVRPAPAGETPRLTVAPAEATRLAAERSEVTRPTAERSEVTRLAAAPSARARPGSITRRPRLTVLEGGDRRRPEAA